VFELKVICVSQRFFPVIGGAEKILEQLMDKLATNNDVMVYTTNAHELDSFWNDTLKPVDNVQTKKYTIKRYEILQPRTIPDLENPLTISYPGPFLARLFAIVLKTYSPPPFVVEKNCESKSIFNVLNPDWNDLRVLYDKSLYCKL
jgi:hypothetical protein